ncbi:MAG: hypothetical protein JNM07_13230 [Phycisphaerae bacterium]|nr:hypothetical protein [Phycisphaerae bacterium]
MLPVTNGVPVGVIAMRARIVRRFTSAGARSPQTARRPDELGLTPGHLFRRMLQGGVLKECPGGRFWLDENADAAFHRRARWCVAAAIAGVGLLVALVLLVR